jgi:hypothetical protein
MANVVTGKVRLSFCDLKEVGKLDGKYGVTALVDKGDKALIEKLKKAIKAAQEEGKTSKWNGKIPANCHNPLRDGDAEDARDEYAGCYYFRAKSSRRPGIVDRERNEIFDLDEVYSGCYARLDVNFYPYAFQGSVGVAVGLNNIQKWADGERFAGGVKSAENAFNDGYEDDTDDLADLL